MITKIPIIHIIDVKKNVKLETLSNIIFLENIFIFLMFFVKLIVNIIQNKSYSKSISHYHQLIEITFSEIKYFQLATIHQMVFFFNR